MKRRAFQIAMLLILGAIVNVAVAWGLAATNNHRSLIEIPEEQAYSLAGNNGRVWYYRWVRRGSIRFVYQFEPIGGSGARGNWDFIAPRWSRARDYIPKPLAVVDGEFQYAHDIIVEDAVGWPTLGLACEHLTALTSDRETAWVTGTEYGIALEIGDDRPVGTGVVEISPRYFHSTALPLRPLWPGFAINTIFYAAILGVVWFTPGMVKRTLRRRRGLCPACAYPIGTSPVCTECGKAIALTDRL